MSYKNSRLKCLFAVLVLISCIAWPAYSQEDDGTKDRSVPTGMEIKKVGNANVMMPKGGTFTKEGDLLVLEGPTAYAARKFVVVEKRLAKIDSQISALQKDMEEIKETLSALQNSALGSKR